MTPRSARSSAVLLLAGLLLTGCSAASEDVPDAAAPAAPSTTPSAAVPSTSPSPSPSPAVAPPAAPAVVSIRDFSYAVPASVPAGGQVTVVNDDAEAHTFTLQGAPEVRLVVPPRGGTMTFTAPAQAGTYAVVCEFHGGMTASLLVA